MLTHPKDATVALSSFWISHGFNLIEPLGCKWYPSDEQANTDAVASGPRHGPHHAGDVSNITSWLRTCRIGALMRARDKV